MLGFQRINVSTAKELLQKEVFVVDIRDEESFRHGHIRGAIHLDNQSLQAFMLNSNKETPVIVCCYHGNSSQQAAAYLNQQGFTQTYSLDGGYESWRASHPDLCVSLSKSSR